MPPVNDRHRPLGITELDLSPIEVFHFEASGKRWEFLEPLRLTPVLDVETKSHVAVQDSRLGIHVFAETVPLLVEELAEQLTALWTGYAEYPDKDLTPKALERKRALISAVRQDSR